jgi:hypothetical protein
LEISENNSNTSIRLTEFFNSDFGSTATKNRPISGHSNYNNPFGL